MPEGIANAPGILFAALLLISASPAESQERITESRDGVSVSLPADEADLADALLKMAKVWRAATQKGMLSSAFEKYLLDPSAAANTQRRVADHLGITSEAEKKLIHDDWEKATAFAGRAIEAWKNWEQGFDTMHFWTRAEADAFRQGDRYLFQDTEVRLQNGGAGFRIRPDFLPEPIDLEALPDPADVNSLRLDFILAYPPGATPGQIAREVHELLDSAVRDPNKGTIAVPAAEIYEEMYRWVFERALERRIVQGTEGQYFRRSLSLAFSVARNDQVDPERGRKRVFGQRLLHIAQQEPETSVSDLGERIRNTPPHPTAEKDTFAEVATREVVLAMVFLSLKNGGPSLDDWIQKQEASLDAGAFSERLDVASGEQGWETIFRDYSGRLADQFVEALGTKTLDLPDPGLSSIESPWPRKKAGRIEVTHPPHLAKVAALAAPRIDSLLGEYGAPPGQAYIPRFSPSHYQWLAERGLSIPKESPEDWTGIYQRIALGGISTLRLRLWVAEDALAAIQAGVDIPGFSVDPETGEISVSQAIGVQVVRPLIGGSGEATHDRPISSLIVGFTREQVATLSVESQVRAIEHHCRESLDQLFEQVRSGDTDEETFFVVASHVVGEYLLREIIASQNREWFVIGLANWIGMQLTDLEFGPGAGRRVFESRWPPAKNEPDRDRIDLMKWTSPTEGVDRPLDAQNAYFATLAIASALEGKDASFLKRWIGEIQKTPYKRTHLGTVIRAYQKVGGGNLKEHAQTMPALP